MESHLVQIKEIWENLVIENNTATSLPLIDFNEITNAIFPLGPIYHYLSDFYDLNVSEFSAGFEEAHGINPDQIATVNDIVNLIHPDDLSFMVKAEKMASSFFTHTLGIEKITLYKISYNLRMKMADDKYHLFNHQGLILNLDENGNIAQSLNIHTNIDHLTQTNSYRISFISITDLPSYLNLEVKDPKNNFSMPPLPMIKFSPREMEIIRLMAEGHNTKSIAGKLFISIDTVKTHRKNILKKGGCKNALELIFKGLSEGWI